MSEEERVVDAIRKYFSTKDVTLQSVAVVGKVSAGGEKKTTRLWTAEVMVKEWDDDHIALVAVSYRYILGVIVVHRDALLRVIGQLWSEDKRVTEYGG